VNRNQKKKSFFFDFILHLFIFWRREQEKMRVGIGKNIKIRDMKPSLVCQERGGNKGTIFT
jgi:hypothetical protein